MQAWFPSSGRTERVLISLLCWCRWRRSFCLSIFVLISQNRFSDAADRRVELDVHMGLLAEHELTRVLQMLDAIQDKLGIENDADSELADLEMETRPEDVLAEIDRVHRQVKG